MATNTHSDDDFTEDDARAKLREYYAPLFFDEAAQPNVFAQITRLEAGDTDDTFEYTVKKRTIRASKQPGTTFEGTVVKRIGRVRANPWGVEVTETGVSTLSLPSYEARRLAE